MRRFLLFLLIGLVCAPQTALACATCFGAADAPQTKAMNMAILSLLGVIGTVLAMLATFIVYLVLRARIVARETARLKEVASMQGGRLVEVNVNE